MNRAILKYFDQIPKTFTNAKTGLEAFKNVAYCINNGCPRSTRIELFASRLIEDLQKTLIENSPFIQVPESEELKVCKLKLKYCTKRIMCHDTDQALRLLLEARDCYIRYCEG